MAALAVDALLWAKIVQKGESQQAVGIVAEEIYARLCVRDYPPPIESPSDET